MIAAGQIETFTAEERTISQEQKDALIDAINESFELLRINYQHLYFSAYSEIDAINAAKRLWMENLSPFEPAVISKATHAVIKHSDYLPTISKIVKQCVKIANGTALPDVYDAYVEACQATSPRQNYSWSHPAVYYAGKKSDWHFLVSSDEKIALPVFTLHYQNLCEAIANGENLPPIKQLALPSETTTPLSKEENVKRAAELLADL